MFRVVTVKIVDDLAVGTSETEFSSKDFYEQETVVTGSRRFIVIREFDSSGNSGADIPHAY
jgi:hypothetical protein